VAKHTGKLTKTVVDGWGYHPNDLILWDGKLTGFGVKAKPGGGKTYVLDYRNQYAIKRRFTIGKHGDKLTADMARTQAENLLARIRLERHDPMADKQQTQSALSVNQLLDLYLESARFAEKTEMTRYNDTGRIKRHLRPTLGKLKVEQLTPDRVRRAFADIRDGKTAVTVKTKARGKAVVRGGAGSARMAIRNLRAILNWAITEGITTTNPAQRLDIGADGIRSTILETPEQYAKLFAALDKMETERRISDAVADCIRVLAFTGARRNEIAAMRWQWVDLDRGIAVLPPRSHKTGHRSGKSKEIQLNAAARSIIARRPKGDPEAYVFPPAKGDGPLVLSSKLWASICNEGGLPDGITSHSLRHSLGTLMAVHGAEAAEIMAALGHTQLSTVSNYIHFARNAKAAMAEKYTAGISAVFNNAPKAQVVELATKRGKK